MSKQTGNFQKWLNTPDEAAFAAPSADALLEIINACEGFQNADTEGVDAERQCEDADKLIRKVVAIASKAIYSTQNKTA